VTFLKTNFNIFLHVRGHNEPSRGSLAGTHLLYSAHMEALRIGGGRLKPCDKTVSSA